jgi:hypothetical protein
MELRRDLSVFHFHNETIKFEFHPDNMRRQKVSPSAGYGRPSFNSWRNQRLSSKKSELLSLGLTFIYAAHLLFY